MLTQPLILHIFRGQEYLGGFDYFDGMPIAPIAATVFPGDGDFWAWFEQLTFAFERAAGFEP